MNRNSPIGVFDSGLGGISVAKEIARELPFEKILYYGDSAHNPYGTKTAEEITAYCTRICDDFMKQDVKAIVIACNTATSACVPLLRKSYPVDIIGMEPALKVAADSGSRLKIAVWATDFTLREKKFARLMDRFKDEHAITRVACPKLVRLVEEDRLDDQEQCDAVLNEYLSMSNDPDVIVLGCTHFIFFKDRLRKLVEDRVSIVDGNQGTVHHLQDLLKEKDLLADEKNGPAEFHNSLPEKEAQSVRLFHHMEVND